jgi:transposase
MDEGRFGLKIRLRRRWCPLGKRPPCPVEDDYEWLWVYIAVDPLQGECFCLFLPRVNGICLECFLQELKLETGEQVIGIVLDNSPSHISTHVHWPNGFQPLPLPSHSPELNPAEQVFRHLRDRLSNQVFDTIEDLEETLGQAIRDFQDDKAKVTSLTAYPWWRQALQQQDIPSFAA